MLFNIPFIEWIGYLGSVIVAISLTMSSIKKLRWFNLAGGTVFSIYGFFIHAYPVGLLNLFIVITDLYYLYKIYVQKEAFKTLLVSSDDVYLDYFLDFYQADIQAFFPKFNKSIVKNTSQDLFIMLLLRNAVVAGVVIGFKNNDTLDLQIDYVTAPFRDLRPGDFIYKKNIELFKQQGFKKIECETENHAHQKYLKKMGFHIQAENDKRFGLFIL
jgi:hypothetical protein